MTEDGANGDHRPLADSHPSRREPGRSGKPYGEMFTINTVNIHEDECNPVW